MLSFRPKGEIPSYEDEISHPAKRGIRNDEPLYIPILNNDYYFFSNNVHLEILFQLKKNLSLTLKL